MSFWAVAASPYLSLPFRYKNRLTHESRPRSSSLQLQFSGPRPERHSIEFYFPLDILEDTLVKHPEPIHFSFQVASQDALLSFCPGGQLSNRIPNPRQ